MKRWFALLLVSSLHVHAQVAVADSIQLEKHHVFSYKPLVVPTVLIAYGVIGLNNEQLQKINEGIRDEVGDHIDRQIRIDDVTMYVPALSVYALNLAGDHGRHNFGECTVIFATFYLVSSGAVHALKLMTHVQRPDGSSFDSFPSGHTTLAFAGAEFLYQEYRDKSVWYGVAGYAVATGTGILRMVNNRHWLTDVAAGAGIGILSTKMAYWIAPKINRSLFGEKKNKMGAVVAPFYSGEVTGLQIGWFF
ncbi:MAG: phosphatase PAP2 family protein [Flavobacterium sp.]|nr:MAG: phosphatase PAP2 family protein [Flavobacterium sp.]